jgi:hypothetical protein
MTQSPHKSVFGEYISGQDQAKINQLVKDRMAVHEPIKSVSFIDGVMTWNFFGKEYSARSEADIKDFLDEFLDGDETHVVWGRYDGNRHLTFEGKVKHVLMEKFKKTFLIDRFPNWEKAEWSDGTTTIVKNGYNWNHFACWLRDICKR